jgi:hypothetical protein
MSAECLLSVVRAVIACHGARCSCRVAAVLLIAAGAFTSSCDRGVPSRDVSGNIATQRIKVLPRCQTTKELEDYYATESLGGKAQVQARKRLVFVQTFPYSGVRASHLYVYAQETAGLRFMGFFRAQTQDAVGLQLNGDGSVEIKIGEERVGVLNQPCDKP